MADETMNFADSGATKQAAIIGLAIVVVALSVLFYTAARVWLCANAWFHSALIDCPALALAIIAWRELGHSRDISESLNETKLELGKQTAEASKANEYRSRMTELEELNVGLREKLAASTQQIADNLKRPPTKAERNAATLKNYMRRLASVSQEGTQPIGYEIVEVSDDNIVTLFLVRGAHSTRSFSNIADCGEMTIEETQHGGCALRMHISKFIGQPRDWGEIPRWEDRQEAAALSIEKASGAAWNASYTKPGSPETRTLTVFQAKDGSNRFQLESSQGWTSLGDNVQVSKDFMITHVEYLSESFTRSGSGTGATQGGYRLYIC
jgi:hypothetical protein